MGRLFFIRVVAPIVFFVFYVYACHQLFRIAALPWAITIPLMLWILAVICFVLIVPAYFWTRPNRGESRLEMALVKACYFCQGYFSYLMTMIIVRDVVGFLSLVFNRYWVTYSGHEAYFILLAPLAFMAAGRVVVETGPFIRKVKIPIAKLAAPLQGLRIVQITDLHIGPGVTLGKIKKVVRKTNQLEPDLVVLTGDIVDHLDKWFKEEINLLATLKSKYGTYYIPGNHEYYWGYDPIVAKIKKIGITVLENENKILKIGKATLAICGVTDLAAKYFSKEEANPGKAIQGAEKCDVKILLAHQPNVIETAKKFDFDVQLSGHTHGGQFIPWSLMIKLFQKYPRGLYNVGKMKLYVSQGTGYWGPADRLGTIPEITEIQLTNK